MPDSPSPSEVVASPAYKASRERRRESIRFFREQLGSDCYDLIFQTPASLRESLASAVRECAARKQIAMVGSC